VVIDKLSGETTDDRRHDELRALVEKAPDADLLREMIGFAAEKLIVATTTGAANGEKGPLRTVQRNGCSDREALVRAAVQKPATVAAG